MRLLGQSSTGEVIISVILVLVGGLLLVILGALVRKWMVKTDDAAANPTGFNLSDLRRLKNEGKMTDEEFERAKAQIVAAAHKASTKPTPAGGISPEPKEPKSPPAVGDD